MNQRIAKMVGLLPVFVLLSAACGDDDASEVVEMGNITTIELVENPWDSSVLNVEVAKQILENELGYAVNVTELAETTEFQWASIDSGSTHASLEVWPSGHAENVENFINSPEGNIADVGLLGSVGKVGWYVPGYMIDQYPELATWEGFTDPDLAALFDTDKTTGNLGQLLLGDPTWLSFEQHLIDNLSLHLEPVHVEQVDSAEAALISAFEEAFENEEPILAYFWVPHALFSALDLREVELPPYTDACGGRDEIERDCGYAADNLFKIVWEGLEEGAPAAWHLLNNFSLSSADQGAMLSSFKYDEMSYAEAAAAWIDANEDIWRAWLP